MAASPMEQQPIANRFNCWPMAKRQQQQQQQQEQMEQQQQRQEQEQEQMQQMPIAPPSRATRRRRPAHSPQANCRVEGQWPL